MADITTKKDEIKVPQPSIWGFVSDAENWKGMGHNALLLRRGVLQSVAGIPAIPGYLADLGNMASQKLTGHSYEGSAGKWIQTKVIAGMDAVDLKILKPEIRNASDQKYADNVELATDVATAVLTLGAGAVKLAGTGAKTAARSTAIASRIEPTLDMATIRATKAVEKSAAKAADDAGLAFEKTDNAAAKAWQAEKDAARAAEEAAKKASAKNADDASAGFSNTSNGAKAAEEAAASGERLGWLRAKRILNDTGLAKGSERSLYDKVRLLHEGGRDDMIPLAIARARAEGKIASEAGLFRVNNQGLPSDLTKRVLELDSKIAGRGPVANFVEKVSSRASSFGESIRYSATHLGETAASAGINTLKTATYPLRHPINTAKGLYNLAVYGTIGFAADTGVRALNGDSVYEAGGKAYTDVKNVAKLGVEGLATVVSVIPFVGAPAADWMLRHTGPVLVNGFKAVTEATDGAMNQAGKDLGLPIDEKSNLRLPGGLGRIASATHNVRNKVNAAEEIIKNGEDATREQRLEIAKQDLKAAGGVVADGTKNALDGAKNALDGFDPTDVEGSWKKLGAAAKANPMLKKMMDVAEQNPTMKYGIILGAGLGFLQGEGAGRLGMALKMGIMFGLMGALLGGIPGMDDLTRKGVGKVESLFSPNTPAVTQHDIDVATKTFNSDPKLAAAYPNANRSVAEKAAESYNARIQDNGISASGAAIKTNVKVDEFNTARDAEQKVAAASTGLIDSIKRNMFKNKDGSTFVSHEYDVDVGATADVQNKIKPTTFGLSYT